MSVQNNIYLMYGMKVDDKDLPQDEWGVIAWGESNSYTTKITHNDHLFLLRDGMNGQYNILGYVVGKTDDDGNTTLKYCQEIDILTEQFKKEVVESIKRNFGLEPECEYFLINHYS